MSRKFPDRLMEGVKKNNQKLWLERSLSKHLFYPHLHQDRLYLYHSWQVTQLQWPPIATCAITHIVRVDIKETFIALPFWNERVTLLCTWCKSTKNRAQTIWNGITKSVKVTYRSKCVFSKNSLVLVVLLLFVLNNACSCLSLIKGLFSKIF